jgi:fructose 1,6-bisphosphatase
MSKITISLIKADIGSLPGHSHTHPMILEKAAKMLKDAEGKLQKRASGNVKRIKADAKSCFIQSKQACKRGVYSGIQVQA